MQSLVRVQISRVVFHSTMQGCKTKGELHSLCVTEEKEYCSVFRWYDSGYCCIFCQMAAGGTDCGLGYLSHSIFRLCTRAQRWVSMMLWAVLIMMHELCQFVTFVVRVLSFASL